VQKKSSTQQMKQQMKRQMKRQFGALLRKNKRKFSQMLKASGMQGETNKSHSSCV